MGRTIISRNRPADFRFVNKIIHPCGDVNKYDKSVTYQDILNFIDVVDEKLKDTTKNMSYSICSGLTLASLPPIEAPHNVFSMHISLTALLSHIFFLRLDSMQFPCAPLPSSLSYTLLGDSWQSLTCLWKKRMYPQIIKQQEMEADVKKIVETTVRRFFICEDRAVRDCIVLSNAQKILKSLRKMKP